MRATYAIDHNQIEKHDLTLSLTMTVAEWRAFVKEVREFDDDRRGVPDEADNLAKIAWQALHELDRLANRSFSVGPHYCHENKAAE